jgi:hypothetical protein
MKRVAAVMVGMFLAAAIGWPVGAQTPASNAQANGRPTPPTRDPHAAGYVEATAVLPQSKRCIMSGADISDP